MAIDLILGLGNPGAEYVRTRHNIGFDVVAEVMRRRGRADWTLQTDAEISVITPGRLVVLARPLRYMNRSGEVALRLLQDLDIAVDRMLVVVDDIDLPLGALRLRLNGGPGTHNGLRSLHTEVGDAFARLRVGVRGTGPVDSLADYVLSSFEEAEGEMVGAVIERAADAVDCILSDGFERAMNTFNRAPEQF